MNKRYVLLIFIMSIIIYLFLTYIYNKLIVNSNMESCYILKEDLKKGQEIKEEFLLKVNIEKGIIKNVVNIDTINNKILNCDLKKGQVLLNDYCIGNDNYTPSIENEIICLKIECPEDFVSYQIGKDSIVNIYYTGNADMANNIITDMNLSNVKNDKETGYISIKMLENIRIIDVFDRYGNSIEEVKENKSEINSIMIEVKSELVNKINNLKNYGKFSLSIVR